MTSLNDPGAKSWRRTEARQIREAGGDPAPAAPHPSPGGLAKDKARWLRPTSSWGKCTSPAPCPGHETTEPSDRSCPCPRPFRPRLREDSAAALSGQHHFPPSWAPLARVQTAVMSPIVAPQPWLESLLSYRDVPQQVGAAFCASPPRALSPKAPVSALMHVCFLSFPSVPPRGELHDLTVTADLPLISFTAVRFRFVY